MQLVMWGPSASGKTIFLAQLFLQPETPGWAVRAKPEAVQEVERLAKRMRGENAFPPPTTVGVSPDLNFRLIQESTGASADIVIKDRAGAESEALDERSFDLIRGASGLLLMFDHTREPSALLTEVQLTMLKLYADRETQAAGQAVRHKDPRPIAICLTKADLLMQTPKDLARSISTPDAFVRESLDRRIVQCVEGYCERIAFFPVSSVGLRVRLGAVDPVVFLDEELGLRLGHLETPVNLIEPFAWIFGEVSRHAGRSAASPEAAS